MVLFINTAEERMPLKIASMLIFRIIREIVCQFFQNLAIYVYFSITGYHVRNIFSTDIFNSKKGSRQVFSTEESLLADSSNFGQGYIYCSTIVNLEKNILSTDI